MGHPYTFKHNQWGHGFTRFPSVPGWVGIRTFGATFLSLSKPLELLTIAPFLIKLGLPFSHN